MVDPAPRLKVLFIEDEPALRLSYERFFRSRFDMAFAASGAEALALLGSREPDIVVLDMRLPDTDGIDLLRRIRQVTSGLPVIITTAYLSIEPQLRVLGLPFAGYFLKPFDLDALGACIDGCR